MLFERESAHSLREGVIRILAEKLGVDPRKIEANPALLNDFHADSLDVVELVMELEEELICFTDSETFRGQKFATG